MRLSTRICFTRISTGEKALYGEYLIITQGEVNVVEFKTKIIVSTATKIPLHYELPFIGMSYLI